MSDAPRPNGTPPTVTAVIKYGGVGAVVEKCPFCRDRHFVLLTPGHQRANCDTWNARAKVGYIVTFDRPTR